MRSPDIRQVPPVYLVPQVPADQLVLDRMLKHLRKLRWIGKEREAQSMFQALGDIRLQPFRLPPRQPDGRARRDDARRRAAAPASSGAAALTD
jgi:hypothetical protein